MESAKDTYKHVPRPLFGGSSQQQGMRITENISQMTHILLSNTSFHDDIKDRKGQERAC